jgi:hypothetical protein
MLALPQGRDFVRRMTPDRGGILKLTLCIAIKFSDDRGPTLDHNNDFARRRGGEQVRASSLILMNQNVAHARDVGGGDDCGWAKFAGGRSK